MNKLTSFFVEPSKKNEIQKGIRLFHLYQNETYST